MRDHEDAPKALKGIFECTAFDIPLFKNKTNKRASSFNVSPPPAVCWLTVLCLIFKVEPVSDPCKIKKKKKKKERYSCRCAPHTCAVISRCVCNRVCVTGVRHAQGERVPLRVRAVRWTKRRVNEPEDLSFVFFLKAFFLSLKLIGLMLPFVSTSFHPDSQFYCFYKHCNSTVRTSKTSKHTRQFGALPGKTQ